MPRDKFRDPLDTRLLRIQHHAGASRQRKIHPITKPVSEKQFRNGKESIISANPKHSFRITARSNKHVLLLMHRSFRSSSASRGVQEKSWITCCSRTRQGFSGSRRDPLRPRQRRTSITRALPRDDNPHLGRCSRNRRRKFVQRRFINNRYRSARIRNIKRIVASACEGINRNRNRTNLRSPKKSRDKFRRIAQHNQHTIPTCASTSREPIPYTIRQLAKLPVANRPRLAKNRDSFRMRIRRTVEKPLRNIESGRNLMRHESHLQKSMHAPDRISPPKLLLLAAHFRSHLHRHTVHTRRHPRMHRHASRDARLNFAAEENVRLRRFQRARFIKPLSQISRNCEIDRHQIVIQLRHLRRAHDRRRNSRLRRHPVQRHLRRRLAHLLRHLHQSIVHAPVTLREPIKRTATRRRQPPLPLSFMTARLAFIFSAQKSTRQRTPRTNREAKFLRRRHMFALDRSLHE